jgi:hypothetical protein
MMKIRLNVISKIFNKSNIFFILILLLFTAPILLNFAYFQTNDDLGMMLISEGNVSGNSEIDLVYPSIFIGYILKLLFTLNPYISWYPILQLLINFTSFYLYLMLIRNKLKYISDVKIKYLMIGISVIFPWSLYTSFFYSYQFSVTAIIATGIGFTIYFFSNSKHNIIALILIFLGIAWRPMAGSVIIGLLSLIFICNYLIYSKRVINFVNIKKIIIIFPIVVLQFSANYYSDIVREDYPGDFYEFNLIRGNLHGNQPTGVPLISSSQSKKIVGFSPNDHILFFNSFFYGDSNIYSTPNLKKLLIYQDSIKNLNFYLSAIKNLLKVLYQDYIVFILVLVFISMALIALSKPHLGNRIILLFLIDFLLFFFYLYFVNLQGRLPGRIFFPSLIVVYIFQIILILNYLESSKFLAHRSNLIQFTGLRKSWAQYWVIFIKKNSIFLLTIPIIFYLISLNLNFSQLIIIMLIVFTFFTFSFKLLSKLSKNNLMYLFFMFIILISTLVINKDVYSDIKAKIDFRLNDPARYIPVINYSYDKPIIAFPSFYTPLGSQNPFYSPFNRKSFSNVIMIGTTLYSPANVKQLNSLGLSNSIFYELANDNAYLGVSSNFELQMVSQFVLEHYGLRIEWPPSPFSYTENGLQVWNVLNSKLL